MDPQHLLGEAINLRNLIKPDRYMNMKALPIACLERLC